jgi:hypothetical protein
MVVLDDTARESTPEALIREARERQRRRRRAVTLVVGALLLALGLFALLGGSGGAAGSSVNRPLPVGIAARAADPAGGPLWGVRLVRARGWTCLQLGRLRGAQLGFVGMDGRFHNDGRFHPFGVSATHQATCVQNDGNGHAFMTIEAGSVPASGSMVDWTGTAGCDSAIEVAGRNRALNRLRRKHIAVPATGGAPTCPAGDERFIEYGLLGPDATSITYTLGGRHAQTERTHGPDGAYLVVAAATPRSCAQFGSDSQCGGPGTAPNSIWGGMIVAVHYRNGRTCQPDSGDTRLPLSIRTCTPVGYVPPKPRILDAQVAAPVTLRVINSRRFCLTAGLERTGFGPAAATDLGIYLPCAASTPTSNTKPGQVSEGVLFAASWIAREPVSSPSSAYRLLVYSPRCGGGGGGTVGLINAGERLTRGVFMTRKCAGAFTATVTYVPNLGPGNQDGGNGPRSADSVLVGRTTLDIR